MNNANTTKLLVGLLTILFIGFKLAHIIEWALILTLSPILLYATPSLLFLIICLLFKTADIIRNFIWPTNQKLDDFFQRMFNGFSYMVGILDWFYRL